MTNFERIKAMNVVDLAIWLNALQTKTVFDFENGLYPSSVYATANWLESEVQDEAD